MDQDDGMNGYQPCALPCPRGMHPCLDVEDHDGPCPPCTVEVGMESSCPHKTLFLCFELEEDEDVSMDCREKVQKTQRCGHVVEAICGDPSSWIEEIPCRAPVLKMKKCGHPSLGLCSEDLPGDSICEAVVAKDYACGHPGPVYCRDGVGNPPVYPCNKPCLKKCWRGHPCEQKCGKPCPECPILVDYNQNCGTRKHRRFILCGTMEPTDRPCSDICRAPLSGCEHECQKVCHPEAGIHGPCKVLVSVSFDGCDHTKEITCEEEKIHRNKSQVLRERSRRCLVLVPYGAETPCGHQIMIPCHLQKNPLPTRDLLQACKVRCDSILECGHPCVGNCFKCHQKKFHVACAQPCGKTLICGHKCKSPCNANCPPCPKKCKRFCPKHGLCRQMCGFPCRPCNEEITECELACRHHKNCQRKYCSDPCTQPACTRPCKRKLKCGHPCISLCGEECPPLCRVCDAETLLGGIFDGSEKVEETHMFIRLQCGHCIEVESLRQYLEAESEDREIFRKGCPLCRMPIWYCQRFQDLIRRSDNDIRAALAVGFGTDDQVLLTTETSEIYFQWNERQRVPPYENEHSFQTYFSPYRHRQPPQFVTFERMYRAFVSRIADLSHARSNTDSPSDGSQSFIPLGSLKTMKTTISWMLEMEGTLYNYHQLKLSESKLLRGVVDETLSWVVTLKFPLKPQSILDLNRAMQRAADVASVLLRMVTYPKDGRPRVFESTTPEGLEAFKNTFKIVLAYEPYTQGVRDMFLANLLKLDDELGHTLGISVEETREIVTAIGGPAGRWFKCRNGHPFVITECGGAMEVGECLECKTPVGGGNHAVLDGIRLASEMDGAVRPAWPTALNHDLAEAQGEAQAAAAAAAFAWHQAEEEAGGAQAAAFGFHEPEEIGEAHARGAVGRGQAVLRNARFNFDPWDVDEDPDPEPARRIGAGLPLVNLANIIFERRPRHFPGDDPYPQ